MAQSPHWESAVHCGVLLLLLPLDPPEPPDEPEDPEGVAAAVSEHVPVSIAWGPVPNAPRSVTVNVCPSADVEMLPVDTLTRGSAGSPVGQVKGAATDADAPEIVSASQNQSVRSQGYVALT